MHTLLLALLFANTPFGGLLQIAGANSPPGTPITLEATCTWEGGRSRAQYVVVVASSLPLTTPVYCAALERIYIDPKTGEKHIWQDMVLAGVQVLVHVTGTPNPVLAVTTNRATLVYGGVEYEWTDLVRR